MKILKNLLADFIKSKVDNYVEPTRKGTYRGDPIGFPTSKYSATLYALYDVTPREIAKILKISYGLLRKWKTEPEFKTLVFQHMEEFSQMFLHHLKKLVSEDVLIYQKFIDSAPIEKLKKGKIKLPVIENDLNLYSQNLRVYLAVKLLEASKKEGLPFQSWAVNLIHSWVEQPAKGYKKIKPNPQLEEERQKLLKTLQKSILDHVADLLGKETITETERRESIWALTLIKDALG